MIANIIRWSISNRLMVILLAAFLTAGGIWSLSRTPLDAIPDLSDVQVIIKTTYPGQTPQVVEDQVTYPLTTAMLAVPGAVTVRGYSFFNDSYVYVIFEDGTDLYWARSRVLEYLSQVAPTLPDGAAPALGPDATIDTVTRSGLRGRGGAGFPGSGELLLSAPAPTILPAQIVRSRCTQTMTSSAVATIFPETATISSIAGPPIQMV